MTTRLHTNVGVAIPTYRAEAHQAAQTRRVNNAAMRWPMQVTRAPTRSQRASRAIVALPVIATTFVMHARVGHQACQLKHGRLE